MRKIAFNPSQKAVTVYIILLLLLAVALLCGCESKSGKLVKNSIATPVEKVVILDSYPPAVHEQYTMYKYKVKRIEHGVVDTIYERDLYEVGDTIYTSFQR